MTACPQSIVIELLSGTTFSSGEGTPGVVDIEVERDAHGLPMLGGKALRGLLRDSWLSMQDHFPDLWMAGHRVLGPHADLKETAILRLGDALVEEPARTSFIAAMDGARRPHPLTPEMLLAGLTGIRWQTAEERTTGAPARATLRSTRVVVHGLKLVAPLSWLVQPEPQDCECLALAVLASRHAGLARNRGRGHLRMTIDGDIEQTRMLARGAS